MRLNWKLGRWVIVTTLVWLCGYHYNRALDPEVQWIEAIYQEKQALVTQQQVPRRILIFGGSGIHFGVDALSIEQSIDVPVFNLGLHAGLGLNIMLASLSETVRPGDIVLFVPEYDLLKNAGTGHFSSSFGAAINRPGMGGFGPKQKTQEILLAGVPGSDRTVQFLKRIMKSSDPPGAVESDANDSYVRRLDRRGTPHVLPQGSPSPYAVQTPISQESLRRLKKFQQAIAHAEAQLVIGLPWLLSDGEIASRQAVEQWVNTLEPIAPVIYAEDLSLKTDAALFGDTVYHLSDRGRELRSQQLAQQLQTLLQDEQSAISTPRQASHK